MARPLFVLAAPRSGSTFFTRALSHCPGLGVTNEAGWAVLLDQIGAFATTPVGETGRIPHTGQEVAGLVPPDYIEAFRAAWREGLPRLIEGFYRRLFPGELVWFGDKIANPATLESARRVLPDAATLLLVRDGRDAVVSMRSFRPERRPRWHDLDFPGLCRRWEEFCARALELGGHHVVRYEDLIGRFEETMSGVFAHLGVDPGAEYFDRVGGAAGRLFAVHGTSQDPAASLGRWRREFDDREKAIAAEMMGDTLAALGYPRE